MEFFTADFLRDFSNIVKIWLLGVHLSTSLSISRFYCSVQVLRQLETINLRF